MNAYWRDLGRIGDGAWKGMRDLHSQHARKHYSMGCGVWRFLMNLEDDYDMI